MFWIRGLGHKTCPRTSDVFVLLPVAARSHKLAVVKPRQRILTDAQPLLQHVGKRRVSTGPRGVSKWVTVTFVIVELKGDKGRMARDRAMLCDAVVGARSDASWWWSATRTRARTGSKRDLKAFKILTKDPLPGGVQTARRSISSCQQTKRRSQSRCTIK
jgi:hypothetical protein